MLLSFLLFALSSSPAAASQQSVEVASFSLPASLTTLTGGINPCKSAKQYVTAIKLHPKGGQAQVYTLQVLDSTNVWQTLNVSGLLTANSDTPWMPLTIGSNRCISQVLVYGDGIGKSITLLVSALVTN